MTTRPGYVWDATASEWVEIGQAAVVSPFKYQASQPSSPATGDIWIDSDDEVPSVDSTLYYRWTKTMSGGETSLSGTDDSSLALEYTPGYESVFINGVLQVRGSDYVATTGTTVTGLTALTASDVVMVESIVAYSVGDTYTQTQIGSLLDAKSPVSTTGLVLLNSTTFSAVASVAIDNVFSATYDNYRCVVNQTGSSTTPLRARMRTGSDDTGAVYDLQRGEFSSTTANAARSSNNSTIILTYTDQDSFRGNFEFLAPNLAANAGLLTQGITTNAGLTSLAFSATRVETTTQYTGFSLIPDAGTITGTIKVYGYK